MAKSLIDLGSDQVVEVLIEKLRDPISIKTAFVQKSYRRHGRETGTRSSRSCSSTRRQLRHRRWVTFDSNRSRSTSR